MPVSMYQLLIPPTVRVLGNLAAILEKGAAHCEAKKIDPLVMTGSRLFPDMFPLSRQVQIATDVAKAGAARLAGQTPPAYEDTEKTFPELIARVHRTIEYLGTFREEHFVGAEQRTVAWKTPMREMSMPGIAYVQDWVTPNVFFHVTTTYNLLRHNGVEVGKPDFLGLK